MKRLLLAGGVTATIFILQVAGRAGRQRRRRSKPVDLPLDQAQQQAGRRQRRQHQRRPRSARSSACSWSCAVIYGLYWILKQVKKAREEQASGSGLHSLASLPLGPNRSLHMIRAGREIVLVGVAEHGVQPIRSYTRGGGVRAGLIDDDGDDDGDSGGGRPTATAPRRPASRPPGQSVTGALDKLRQRTVRK